MYKFHAAQERGGGESRYVTNDAAANSDDQRLAIGSRATEGTSYLFYAAKIFCGLCIIKEMNGATLGKPQPSLNGFPHGAPDFGRGNDMNT